MTSKSPLVALPSLVQSGLLQEGETFGLCALDQQHSTRALNLSFRLLSIGRRCRALREGI